MKRARASISQRRNTGKMGVVKPITEEERQAGKRKELEKMAKFKTFKVVPTEEAKGMILVPTWVEPRKPDGSVRERYCLREVKSSPYIETMSTQYPQLLQLAASLTWSV